MKVVDLRSDTITQPTPAMRNAMAQADVGDDVFQEDPTVNKLEKLAAELGSEIVLPLDVAEDQQIEDLFFELGKNSFHFSSIFSTVCKRPAPLILITISWRYLV